MKKIILSLAVFVSIETFAQADSITLYFEKLINRKIDIPSNLYNDTCYLTSTLLKVDVDEHSNVFNINFSDNAENWLKRGLSRINSTINKEALRRYCIKQGIRSKIVIIPVVIQSSPEKCIAKKHGFQWHDDYLNLNGNKLKGNCFFREPVFVTLGNSVN